MKNLFKIGILIFSLSILSCSGNIDKQIVVNQVSLEKEDIIEDKCNVNYSLIDSSKYNYHLSVLEVLSDSNQSLDGKLYTMLMFSLDSNENKKLLVISVGNISCGYWGIRFNYWGNELCWFW